MKPTRGKTPRKAAKRNKPTDPVEVYCRLRPIPENIPRCCRYISAEVIQLTPSEHAIARNGEVKETQYSFSQVFDEFTTQKSIFDYIALPLVDDVIHGKNALLFAYGVTSSGKTYTMEGVPNEQGILPNCLDVIFNSIGHLQAKRYVFKPDKVNGFDIQSEADAMMERQQRDILPKISQRAKEISPNDLKNANRAKNMTKIAEVDEDNVYSVFVSYIELYNNYVYDLLEEQTYDPITGFRPPQSKVLREDTDHNMYVSGVVEVLVNSAEDAFEVLERGKKRRRVAHTQLNAESSRSHSVFNIRIVQSPLDPSGREAIQDKSQIAISQLSLVDLAGSERTARTGNQGDRLKEASLINQSLMTLRICMEKLRENQMNDSKQMVPYRDSKLTHLFKNYFDGEGKVRMVVCVNPDVQDYDEILQVMRFAQMARDVQVTRPEQVKFNALTPGRRKLGQLPSDDGTSTETLTSSSGSSTQSINPPPLVPCLKMADIQDASTNKELLMILKASRKWFSQCGISIDNGRSHFRDRLTKLESRHQDLVESKENTHTRMASKDAQLKKFEQRIKRMKENNAALQHQNAQLAQEKKEAENEQSRIKSKLRQVIDTESSNVDYTPNVKPSHWRLKKEIPRSAPHINPARSEPDLTGTTRHHRYPVTTPSRHARSPPPTKPKPPSGTVNRMHRRSKSTDTWIEHKPACIVETSTVMQPVINKRKSVTNLSEKDLKGDKYALTHQDLDSDGDLRTKLVKGDIVRTRSGGKAVVFNEVENITQKSPGTRKRRSNQENNQGVVNVQELEDRCHIGIEGHDMRRKRSKASQV